MLAALAFAALVTPRPPLAMVPAAVAPFRVAPLRLPHATWARPAAMPPAPRPTFIHDNRYLYHLLFSFAAHRPVDAGVAAPLGIRPPSVLATRLLPVHTAFFVVHVCFCHIGDILLCIEYIFKYIEYVFNCLLYNRIPQSKPSFILKTRFLFPL